MKHMSDSDIMQDIRKSFAISISIPLWIGPSVEFFDRPCVPITTTNGENNGKGDEEIRIKTNNENDMGVEADDGFINGFMNSRSIDVLHLFPITSLQMILMRVMPNSLFLKRRSKKMVFLGE